MVVNDVNYNSTIRELIITNLDGWEVIIPPEPPNNDEPVESSNDDAMEPTETETTTTPSTDIDPFMTTDEIKNKANKKITDNECKLFYEETLDQAYMHTNRLNIDDLTEMEARIFIRAVCKWTASNLWNKYNIRVNNEDMEDTYVQSYGGLLYKSALKTLQQFINQRINSLSSINNDKEDNEDVWII